MRNIFFFISSLLVVSVFNCSIWQKEKIKAHGEVVLLELTPVDPRSLMQGDYMRLRYAIERDLRYPGGNKRAYMVIAPDPNGVARFIRFHGNESLAPGEKLLHFHINGQGSIRIVPDSFMFQEGQAPHYQAAKYGIFKFDAAGNHILVGLADNRLQAIEPGP